MERKYIASIGGREYEATLKIRYLRGRPGVWYLRNGDPGYPPEPDDFDIVAVICDGADERIRDRIAEIAYEDDDLRDAIGEAYAEEMAAAYEYLADSKSER